MTDLIGEIAAPVVGTAVVLGSMKAVETEAKGARKAGKRKRKVRRVRA
jgi:hypothetical protein